MSQQEETRWPNSELDEPGVVAALRKVIQERRLTKEFLDTKEAKGILTGLREAMHNQKPHDVWISLSIAGRAASVSKPMESVFLPIVMSAISAHGTV